MSNTYYVAKLNINENIFSSREKFNEIKMKLIPSKILSFKNGDGEDNYTPPKKKARYTLADIEKMDTDIISGKIVKLFGRELEYVNKGKTVKKPEQDGKECNFFYSIKNELFLLEKSSLYKGGQLLLTVLENLIGSDYEIGELNIRLLKTSQNIKKILINDKIKRIQFNYIHPNDKDTIDQFSNAMDSIEASRGKMIMDASKGKTLILTDEHGNIKNTPQNMLEYTNNGYGDITVVTQNNKTIKFSNSKYALQEELPNDISPTKISEIFTKIKNRLKHK